MLAALLGELHLLEGKAHTAADSGGSVGYCGQQVWVGRGTVRHNVLFGRSLDEARHADTNPNPNPDLNPNPKPRQHARAVVSEVWGCHPLGQASPSAEAEAWPHHC